MIKKVLFSCISVLLLLFVSCGEIDYDKTMYFGYISPDQITFENGLIFIDYGNSQIVKFADFDSLITVPICPKPNCPHTDENECSALGIKGTIFVYNNSLCWLANEMRYDDVGNLTDNTTLYMSNTDGTNRRQVAELEGYRVSGGAFVYDKKVYFCATDVEYESEMSADYALEYLYSYDFSEKKFAQIEFLAEGYNSGAYIRGSFGNALFMIYQGTPELGMRENYDEHRKYALYNLENNELDILDKNTVSASEDCLICFNDDGTVFVRRLNGEEICISSDRIIAQTANDYKIINDILISSFYGVAYDLKTGTEYNLNNSGVVIAYYNRKYILKNNSTGEIFAVGERELLTSTS